MSQQARMTEVTVCDICDKQIDDIADAYSNTYKLRRGILNADICWDCVSKAVYKPLKKKHECYCVGTWKCPNHGMFGQGEQE